MATEFLCRGTKPKKNSSGFTLIELMIVVVIVAILAAIAMPMYDDYIKRGRIAEGLVPLADMEARMEQYFQDNRRYVGVCPVDPNIKTVAPKPVDTDFFDYRCEGTESAYTAEARGKGVMGGFVYKLVRADGRVKRQTEAVPVGWGENMPKECWVRAKGGVC